MADRSIRVAVLEGDFASLSAAGFPLSLSLQLQESALKLSDAMWTAKSTAGGFSVSFFWPSVSGSSQLHYDKKEMKKKKRKRKTKAKKAAQCKQSSANSTAEAEPNPATPGPINVHHGPELSPESQANCTQNSSSTSTPNQTNLKKGINLNSCSNVKYDKRGAVHGVTYSNGDEEGWTPVIGKRAKRSVPLHLLRLRAPPHVNATLPSSDESTSYDSDSDCSESYLNIPDHATVKFSAVHGKPGLQVITKRTRSWTPIAARTRAKFKY